VKRATARLVRYASPDALNRESFRQSLGLAFVAGSFFPITRCSIGLRALEVSNGIVWSQADCLGVIGDGFFVVTLLARGYVS